MDCCFVLVFGERVLLNAKVVADAFIRPGHVEALDRNLNMMVRWKVHSEVARFRRVTFVRQWIRGAEHEAAEDVHVHRLVTHVVGRLAVVLEFGVVAVAVALGRQIEPAVAHVTERLVDALGENLAHIARVVRIRAQRIVVLHSMSDACVPHHFLHAGCTAGQSSFVTVYRKIAFVVTFFYN